MVRSLLSSVSGVDNPGLYSRARQAVKSVEKTNAGRVSRAQDGAWKYRMGMERGRAREEAEVEAHAAAVAADATELTTSGKQAATAVAVLDALKVAERERAEEDAEIIAARKASQPKVQANDESAQWRFGPVGFSRGGYAGLVDERIEAARAAGAFTNNKGRGKPLVREVDYYNPFLKREEFFMNRIIKRQGSAPPWVELAGDLERDIISFRSRMTESWVRRAARMITSTPALKRDCDPLPTEVIKQAQQRAASAVGQSIGGRAISPSQSLGFGAAGSPNATLLEQEQLAHLEEYVQSSAALPGHGMLLETCKSYRDPEWQEREHKYHSVALQDLNVKVRRYNGLAPYHTRRAMLDKELELERLYESSGLKIALAVSQDLMNERHGLHGGRASTAAVSKKKVLPTYDFWGNEIKPPPEESEIADTDFFDRQPQRPAPEAGEERAGDMFPFEEQSQRQSQASGVGILILLRRTGEWLRSRVGA